MGGDLVSRLIEERPLKRYVAIAAAIWLVAGSILFLHGALTGDGVAATAFDWEFRHGATIWSLDIYEGLLFILVAVPAAVLVAVIVSSSQLRSAIRARVSPPPQRVALWASFIGMASILVAGLLYARAQLLPGSDAVAIEIALDQIPAPYSIPEGQAIVLGVAHLELAIRYEEGSGSGKTGTRRYGRRLTPITSTHWLPSEPVRIVSNAPMIDVRSPVPGRYRHDREDDAALAARSAGILLGGQIPGFIRMAFARRGVTLSPDVLLQSTDDAAGKTGWYVCAALFALAGASCNGVGVIFYAKSLKIRS